MKLLHSYNLFLLSEGFQRSQTPTYILIKKKLNNKFPKIYTPHGSPWNIVAKIFHMNNHVWINAY